MVRTHKRDSRRTMDVVHRFPAKGAVNGGPAGRGLWVACGGVVVEDDVDDLVGG